MEGQDKNKLFGIGYLESFIICLALEAMLISMEPCHRRGRAMSRLKV